MLSSMKTALLNACVAAGVAAACLSAHAPLANAQDQEAGDIRVDLPRRKAEPVEPTVTRTRASVGSPGPLRFYGGFSLAVGGDAQVSANVGNIGGNASRALDPTIGLQAGADYVLGDYFSIGGETRLLWTKVDGAGDRTMLWDLDVKPRGRYAFHNLPLEVYGALPVGLTIANLPGNNDGKAGFNIGLLGGANYWFTSHIAVNAEVGWVFHRYGYTNNDTGISGNVKMNQFLCIPTANLVYAL